MIKTHQTTSGKEGCDPPDTNNFVRKISIAVGEATSARAMVMYILVAESEGSHFNNPNALL